MSCTIFDISQELPWHPTRTWCSRRLTDIDTLVLHCTASRNQNPYKTNEYHITPGPQNHLSEQGAAHLVYHFFITDNGTIYQCNALTDWTWACGSYNKRSLSVALAYEGAKLPPPAAQLEAAIALMAELAIELDVPPDRVWGHRELNGMSRIVKGKRVYSKACFLPGTQVLTSSGYKKIETLTAPESVPGPLTFSNQTVTEALENPYEGETVTFSTTMDNSTPITSTADHLYLSWKAPICDAIGRRRCLRCRPLTCTNKNYLSARHQCSGMSITEEQIISEIEWRPIDSLTTKDFMAVPLGPSISDNIVHHPELAWLAGIYLAEGSRYQYDSIQLSLNKETEVELANTICQIAEKHGFPTYRKEDRTSLRVIINNCFYRKVVRDFVEGNNALKKRLTASFMSMPPDYQKHLLDGYIIGDGCEDSRRVRIATSSAMLSHQIFLLVARQKLFPVKIMGRPERTHIIEGRTVNAHQEYSVEWCKSATSTKAMFAGNYFLMPIDSIEYGTYNGPVYNLEVENDECYYVNGSVVAHNCPGFAINLDDFRTKVKFVMDMFNAAQIQ